MRHRLFLHMGSVVVELRVLQFNLSGKLIYVEDINYNTYLLEEPINLVPLVGHQSHV